jgi:hypothetical protein
MCELTDLAATGRPVQIERYDRLHRDGRKLIQDWLERAIARGHGAESSFEAFIYLWIAFNGWAACVTGKDADREWQRALIADPNLNEQFDRLASKETATRAAAHGFAELWPIFRVADLRARGIDCRSGAYESRAAMTRAYLDSGARQFAPRCYLEHDEVPLDWGHILASLYRVRCNLFHGEKARSSENDRLVVARACETLLAFLEEAGLLCSAQKHRAGS